MDLKDVKGAVKELKTEGDGMMKKSHYADAAERYIEAIKLISKQSVQVQKKLKPWVPVLLSLQATCHLKTGAWKMCVTTTSQAIDLGKRDDPKMHYCQAQALENLGELESAASAGKRAHKIDSSGAYHDALLLAHRCDVRRLGVLKGPKPRPQDFEITTVLGEGNYTRVLKAVSIHTPETFAIKTVTYAQVEKTERRHKNVKNELLMEREVLVKFNHPNIVHLYHTFKDANALYYLFEYCKDSTELFHVLCTGEDTRKEFMVRSIDESLAAHYLIQIVVALEYIHGMGVVHRDLKPENVMVRPNGSIFLIDFGTAKNLIDVTHNGPEFVGTPEYMSPEAVDSKPVGPEGDLWALGCIAYQMLSGQNAFQGGSQYMTFLRQKKGEYSSCPWFSTHARNFVEALLQLDPTKRLGSGGKYKDIKNHPFLHSAFQRLRSVAEVTDSGDTSQPLPTPTSEEKEMRRLVQGIVNSEIEMLKVAKLHTLPEVQQRLLQHKCSERHLMSNPEILRLFFNSRDEAIFQRASIVEPYERRYLGMSIHEENKFTRAFAFVHLTVNREREDQGGMLRRAVAAINRIHPRPRFVVMSGATAVQEATTVQATTVETTSSTLKEPTQYQKTMRLLAPNVAVVTVPGASDFPNGTVSKTSLQAYRAAYGADFYSFWIGRIMYVVLNSVLLSSSGDDTGDDAQYVEEERKKQMKWFEREVYIGRTRGTQVHVLISNPLFLKKLTEERCSGLHDVLLPIDITANIVETLQFSWGKYTFASHPTRNGKGIHRGDAMSYEECDVRSFTTSDLHGPVASETDLTNSKGKEEVSTGGGDTSFVGGVRVVRVFESFAKPEYWRVSNVPSSIDLDLKTNQADEDQGNVVPSTAQNNAAPTWMSTPTGGETKIRRPESIPSENSSMTADIAEEDDEDEDEDELIIEDVTSN